MTDERWWAANAGLFTQVLDEDAYPLAVRVGSAAGAAQGSANDPEHAYRFGLQRLSTALPHSFSAGSKRQDRAAVPPAVPQRASRRDVSRAFMR